MEKTSVTKAKFGSARRLLKVFSLTNILGKRDFEGSSLPEKTGASAYSQASTKGLADTHFSSEAYRLSNQRKVEVETEKAMLISLSRHPRWKGAGGPC